jgi:PadR family transcriptional regulator PadR
MKGYIGELEELVLLTVAVLGDDAYGVPIKDQIEQRASRTISLGALHSTIARLEEKGFLKSYLGGATHERGGRRKRYFQLTQGGKAALRAIKNLRDELWQESKISLGLVS